MLASAIPTKFPIPFANGAGAPYVAPIPVASQIGVNPGRASLTDGFVPLNFTPLASGGIPPFGQDVNGILKQISQWCQWLSAGAPIPYDGTFQTAIGGYPKGAIIESATVPGKFWLSLADNNTTNPDTGEAGWKSFVPGSSADYYLDVGSVNALAFASTPPVAAYVDGLSFLISPAHANTAATTLNVSGVGVAAIVHPDGSALAAGEVQPGQLMRVAYLGSSFQWLNAPYVPTRPLSDNSNFPASTAYADRAALIVSSGIDFYHGAIYGLILAPTPGLTTTSITTAVGACRDSTNTVGIKLLVPVAKLLTSNWAAGTGNGGNLDGTALANGQTWFTFILFNPTTLAVDTGFSQSPTSPPLPSGFTLFRRTGAILLEAASTNIRQFVQIGDWFIPQLRSTDYAVTSNGGLISYYRTISVPVGIIVEALMYFQSTGTADANAYLSGIYNPAFGSPPAFGVPSQWAQVRRGAFYGYPGTFLSYGTTMLTQFTDSSAHIYTRSSDTSDVIALGVVAWRDDRGKFY